MTIYALEDPNYQPAMRIITLITKAVHAVVTTSFDHDYITGEIVRIYIPYDFGMPQIDRKTGTITVLSPTTFSITIDTRNFDTFIDASAFSKQRPQVVPIGEVVTMITGAGKNVLPTGDR